jgi:membrane protease YdiL (CAAX protease family)
MLELFSVVWKLFMVRDSVKKGELNWRMGAVSVLFVVLLYAIALPAAILWVNHPQYEPVFIAAMALDGVLFVAFMAWAIKWRAKQKAARSPQAAAAVQATAEQRAGPD